MQPSSLLTILTCSGLTGVHSFSWSIKQSSQSNPVRPHEVKSDENNIWQSGELEVILDNHDKLESYVRKPDCFRRVANSIRIQCGELDMHEGERVSAAVSMALCELATAKHSPPLECISFMASAGHSAPGDSIVHADACVEALSRSAQYWSSYSGYLREIPQLCHAYRRWNDIDMAREVYRNASLEAISILRVVNNSEHRQQSFYKDFHDVGKQLTELVNDLNKVNFDMGKSTADVRQEFQAVNEQAIGAATSAFNSLLDVQTEAYQSMLSAVSAGLHSALSDHATELGALAPSLKTVVKDQLSVTLKGIQDQYLATNEIALSAHATWHAVSNEMVRMQETVSALVESIGRSVLVLDAHIDQAVLANRLQIETSDAVQNIGAALTSLANSTRLEMDKINETAIAIREQWLSTSYSSTSFLNWGYWDHWSKYGVHWLVQAFFRDSGALEHLLSSPLLRFAGVLCRFIWHITYVGLTSLTSILLLGASWRQWVFPRAQTPDTQKIACSFTATEKNGTLLRSRTFPNPTAFAPEVIQSSHSPYKRFSRIPDRLCRTSTE